MYTRYEFVRKLKNQLDELNSGIEKIEKRMGLLNESAKAETKSRIKYLRIKRDTVLSKIHEIKNTTEEAWHTLKQDAENTIEILKDSITETLVQSGALGNELVPVRTRK